MLLRAPSPGVSLAAGEADGRRFQPVQTLSSSDSHQGQRPQGQCFASFVGFLTCRAGIVFLELVISLLGVANKSPETVAIWVGSLDPQKVKPFFFGQRGQQPPTGGLDFEIILQILFLGCACPALACGFQHFGGAARVQFAYFLN